MAEFTARIDRAAAQALQRKIDQIKAPLTVADAEQMGRDAVRVIKSLISSGISPIAGNGRFPSYKNPKRYPGKRKPSTPVNLYLKGDMLGNLSSHPVKARFGYSASIGYTDPRQQIKERGHREGANTQPRRPTIPIVRLGETFAQSVQDVFRKTILAALGRISRQR